MGEMENENSILIDRILKEFTNRHFDKRLLGALNNINHPLYSELSERLQLPTKTIFQIILENVPRVIIERNR